MLSWPRFTVPILCFNTISLFDSFFTIHLTTINDKNAHYFPVSFVIQANKTFCLTCITTRDTPGRFYRHSTCKQNAINCTKYAQICPIRRYDMLRSSRTSKSRPHPRGTYSTEGLHAHCSIIITNSYRMEFAETPPSKLPFPCKRRCETAPNEGIQIYK